MSLAERSGVPGRCCQLALSSVRTPFPIPAILAGSLRGWLVSTRYSRSRLLDQRRDRPRALLSATTWRDRDAKRG
jgi:hypothetical protein